MLPEFAARLIAWQRLHGRHDLPWQAGFDPYPLWVSEIMLQQTQVETVIPYYQRFLAHFPNLAVLAGASLDEVLLHWAGLGYYSRARNLHKAAQQVMALHGGYFPRDLDAIQALPGIGRSTASAIAAFAFDARCAILDGNVKRVLTRVFGVEGWPGEKAVENRLWTLAEALLPDDAARGDMRAYTQGLMDFGATHCTRSRPRCTACPFADDCLAHQQGRQSELPERRPKKTLPEKSITMLILLNAGEVLLEKRPPTGIWGGLWSLPECDVGEHPEQVCAGLGYPAETVCALPEFTHTFTHYRLHIYPRMMAAGRSGGVEQPGRLWLPLAEAGGAALPTPVQRILAGLSETSPKYPRLQTRSVR